MTENYFGMSDKLVSIIIPVYNGEKYIDMCMESMLSQTYENIEIIMVDDGSRDMSGELCDKYSKADCRVKVIHQENKGLSGARNAGIAKASGEYVIFFDVDDTVDKNVIRDNIALAVENDADVVMFCFWYYNVDEDKLIPNTLDKTFIGNDEEFFHNFLISTMDTEVFNAPWNKLIKKSVLDNNGLRFDSRYPIYEDIIFASELLNIVKKIVVNNKMYYKYFVRSSGSLITRFYDTFFDSVTQFHNNAMEYCKKYEDNEAQIRRFNKLYSILTIGHLKQISCNTNLKIERKYELIKRICEDKQFIDALNNTEFQTVKKRIMRRLINEDRYKCICSLYKTLNKLQRK